MGYVNLYATLFGVENKYMAILALLLLTEMKQIVEPGMSCIKNLFKIGKIAWEQQVLIEDQDGEEEEEEEPLKATSVRKKIRKKKK